MKDEIKYSHIDYILVRTEASQRVDVDTFFSSFDNLRIAKNVRTEASQRVDVDTFLSSFDNLRIAKNYALKDIQETMRSLGIVYSKECDNAVSYEKYCGNDYWCYESDGLCISWEIRKIHHRTTSKWDDPEYVTKWKRV